MTFTLDRAEDQQHECGAVGHALPASEHSPSLARAIVREVLDGLPEATVDTAQALVSELVINAVLQARSALVLHVRVAPDRVRVGVEDLSSDHPRLHEPSPDVEHERGLMLVNALASAWGWDRSPIGKQVWFELPTRS